MALKLIRRRRGLSEEVVRRFLREARALAAVDHENVVRIYHVIDKEGIVRWKFVEVNYRIRPENADILEALQEVQRP